MKIALRCGSVYFLLMSVAHAIGLKVPLLFIYFNVPSTVYQDRLISALVMSWAILFWMVSIKADKQFEKLILVVSSIAIVMLSYINFSTDFSILSSDSTPTLYHIQTGALALYWFWLFMCYKIKYR